MGQILYKCIFLCNILLNSTPWVHKYTQQCHYGSVQGKFNSGPKPKTLTVCFSRADIGEQQQSHIFTQGTEKSEDAQQLILELSAKAPLVEAEVGCGHKEAWGRVQANAKAPDIALWCEANSCTDGWEVVVDLQKTSHTVERQSCKGENAQEYSQSTKTLANTTFI